MGGVVLGQITLTCDVGLLVVGDEVGGVLGGVCMAVQAVSASVAATMTVVVVRGFMANMVGSGCKAASKCLVI